MALTGGLVVRYVTDRPAFRSVLLHELAHVRNGDVSRTYFAIAVWWAFVITALVPMAAALALGTPRDQAWAWTWRVVALTALVYLTRNSVLRAREEYADLRASGVEGPDGALGRVLESLPALRGGWPRPLRLHPEPAERRQLLDDTEPLLRMGVWEPFAAGCATGVALFNLDVLLAELLPAGLKAWSSVLAGALLCYLALAVVGMGVWRWAFADLWRSRSGRPAAALGLSLGLGLVAGLNASLAGIPLASAGLHLFGLGLAPADLAWDGVLILGVILLLGWVRAAAEAWLPASAGRTSPRLGYRLALGLGGLVLALWLATLTQVAVLASAGGDIRAAMESGGFPTLGGGFWINVALGLFVVVAGNPAALLVTVFAWWLPLAAGRQRRRPPEAAEWAYLDPVPAPLAAPAVRDRLSQRLAAPAVGVVAFIAFWPGALVALGVIYGLSLGGSQLDLAVGYVVALTVGAQAGAGAAAWALAREQAVTHGLLAAFVAGVLLATALVPPLLLGGLAPLNLPFVVTALVNAGALATLVVIGLVRLVHRPARPARPVTSTRI
ncbi:MAG: M48 family metalloprotease [Candidatus Dormibacteraeota bacterium]|nr:M48 family metalloprotease [Candidatus Dormibacteraeota bacterium]